MNTKKFNPLLILCAAVLLALGAQGAAAQGDTEQARDSDPVGAPLHISPAALRLVQQQLETLGFNPGPVDGIWGKGTSRALSSFQRNRNLEAIGLLTPDAIQALGLPQVLAGAGHDQFDQGIARQEQVRGSGAQLFIGPSALRQIQQKLKQQGYDPGLAHGNWDQETQEAVKQFQHAAGLEPTGNLDLRTISTLGLNPLIAGLFGGQQGTMAQADETNRQAALGYYGQPQAPEQARQGGPAAPLPQHGKIVGAAPLYVSPMTVRQIKQAFNQAGYDAGSTDGAWDRDVQKAARLFQQAHGLEPTGHLNLSTARAAIGGLNVEMAQGGVPGPADANVQPD